MLAALQVPGLVAAVAVAVAEEDEAAEAAEAAAVDDVSYPGN